MSVDLVSQWPAVVLVALVASAMAGFFWKIWGEWKEYQSGQNAQWQSFIKDRDNETKAWQLEMARTIDGAVLKLDGRLNKVEDITTRLAALMEVLLPHRGDGKKGL